MARPLLLRARRRAMPFGSFSGTGAPTPPIPPIEDDMILLSTVFPDSVGGALFAFMSNTGSAQPGPVVGSETTNTFPVLAAKTFKSLGVIIPGNIGNITGVAIVVTLVRYPAGTPLGAPILTPMTVTIPIGHAAGELLTDLAHSVDFAVGDCFDIRIDVPQATSPGANGPITVTLN